MNATVLNYGGGRQTVALCILIAKGVVPRPDRIVMADTSRENPMTWDYLDQYTRPFMQSQGLEIEIAGHELATVDTYGKNGDLLLPVYTQTGKLSGFCSGEWKRDVCERHLRKQGISGGTKLLGYAYDEKRRWKKSIDTVRHNWTVACPLVDLMLTTQNCLTIIKRHGWPPPHVSSCWFCPQKENSQWRYMRDNYPELFEKACQYDEQFRENDEQGGVWLHHSRVPLREADLSTTEKPETMRQCSLGMCFGSRRYSRHNAAAFAQGAQLRS